MTPKEQALAEITALVRTHDISPNELVSWLARHQIEVNKKSAFTLNRVFSYLGGIFILSGLIAFIALAWDGLNSFARIIITYGPGAICLFLAIAWANQGRQGKNITVLVVLSAWLQCGGMFVGINEFSTGGGDIRVAQLLVFGILGLQYGLCFMKIKRTSFLFFALYFSLGAFVNACDLIGIPANLIEFVCGISLIAMSYGIQRTAYNSICEFGYFIGSVALLWMGYDLLEGSAAELLYLGIAAFMLYVSTIVRSRSMLVCSAIAIFSYISYFTARHFLDSMGWPICLILLGMVFFGISNVTLRLNRQIAA